MLVLGIETSCDETGLALYDAKAGLVGHVVYSQIALHRPFGGVMPEQASRDHIRKIIPLLAQLCQNAHCQLKDINAVAFTKGPGLMGALLVGAMFARTLAMVLKIPAIGIHHLEGHLLAPFLEAEAPPFPFLALLVSGGHTELIQVNALGDYHILGETLDDAAGEAFDKTARLLGLGYPGGKVLSELAQKGTPKRFQFPRPMIDRPGLDFSFSGLKTFAANTIAQHSHDEQTKADIAYAFQEAVVDTLTIKCKRALQAYHLKNLVIAGGVGANQMLRVSLKNLCRQYDIKLYFPREELCTDNGAMIAYAGCQRLQAGLQEPLAVTVHPRWPLDQITHLKLNETNS